MQPCTQFKLMLSLSTDRICNQSTTQAPWGQAVLMKSEEKQKSLKEQNPRVHTFTISIQPFFFFQQCLMSTDKNHKKQCSYSKSFESSVVLNSEMEESYFQRRVSGKKKSKLTKCQQLNAEMHGQGRLFNKLWHHTPINITWGRTES